MWHQIVNFAEVKITLSAPWAAGGATRVRWMPHSRWDASSRRWVHWELPVEMRQGAGRGPNVPSYAGVPTLDHGVAWHGVTAGVTLMDDQPASLYGQQLTLGDL